MTSSDSEPDTLATYLDEAVSRALGNPPRPVPTGPLVNTYGDQGELEGGRVAKRVAARLAHNRAGHALRLVTGTSEHLRALRADLDALAQSHHQTWQVAASVRNRVEDLEAGFRGEIEHRVGALHAAIAGLELATDEIAVALERFEASTADIEQSLGSDDDFDEFYAEFELRFRGSPDEIKKRLEGWLPMLNALPRRGEPVLDIASGRGEWLALLADEGIRATGVDLSPRFAAQSADEGLDVIRADAFDYLEALPEGSIGALTAFQFIEHLSTAQLLRLLRLGYRALRPGGGIILETPNPSNLRVAAFSFYLDPTHKRPVHPELLRFAVERCGFVDIGLHFANPSAERPRVGEELATPETSELRKLVEHVQWALFGPQDYGVVAVKPMTP